MAMSIDVWIEWLRGPVFWAALAFMFLGLGRHLAITVWAILRAYRRAADKKIPVRQVLRATLTWTLPFDRLGNRLLYGLSTLAFHVSVILVPVFLAGHIALWQSGLGLSWPAIPNTLATTLTVVAIVAAVAIVVQRLASPESRALSRVQDFVMPLLVAVPFVFGFLVMHPSWNPLSYEIALLAHVLSADLLLFLVPLTKLSHMVLLPTTQLVSELAWHFPADAGARVGQTLGKANEPI
jgi:nitrate reductase gamma subunit